ncbi:rootletin-like [Nyctibius grandis]|uniref:rootletin-like n=1 Tax=Nyctibius grandis TaxID=48427 RepID=UPI0035BC880E
MECTLSECADDPNLGGSVDLLEAITLLLIGWVAQAHLQAEAVAQERAQAQGEQRRLHNLLQEIKVSPATPRVPNHPPTSPGLSFHVPFVPPRLQTPLGDLRGQAADPQVQLGGRQERVRMLEAENRDLQHQVETLRGEHEARESHLALRLQSLEAEAAWRKRALGEAEGHVRGLAAHLQDTESAVAALCPVAAGAATGGDTETAGGSNRDPDWDPDSSPAAPARPGVSAATAAAPRGGAPPASKRPPGDLRGQVADPQVQLGGRQELVSMLEAENRDLQHQLETLRVEQEAIESHLARRLQNVEEERDRWRREAEVLETENQQLRAEAVQEEQALVEAERHVRELTARLQNIEAQLAQALEWEATAQERTLAQREQQLQALGIEPLHLFNEELQGTIWVFRHTQPVLPQERGRQRCPGPLHIPPGDERSLVLFNRLFPPDASQQDVLKDIALLLQIAQIRAITLLLIGWVAQAHLQAEAAAQERAQAQGEQRRLHNLLQEIKVSPATPRVPNHPPTSPGLPFHVPFVRAPPFCGGGNKWPCKRCPPRLQTPPWVLRGQAADPQVQLGGRQERVRVLEAENRDLQHQVETLQGEHEARESHLALRLQSLEAERDFLQREAEGLKSEIRQLEAEAAWRKRALGEAEGRVWGLAAHLQDTESAVAAVCPVAAGAATGGDTETAGGSDRDPDRDPDPDPDSGPAAPARPGVSAATVPPPASKRPPGDLRGQVADPQVQLGGRQELVSMLEADNRDLQHQLETLRVEQEAIESLLARRLQNVEEERDRWRCEAEVLETENRQLRAEAVQEEQALEEAERHVRELTARLQNIEAQLAQALEWEATAQERTLAQREQQLQALGIEPLHLFNEELQGTIRVFCHTQPVLPQERGRQRGPGPLHIPPGDERSLVQQVQPQAHLQAEAAACPPRLQTPPWDLRGQAANTQAELGGRQERVRMLEAENRDLQHQVETLRGEHEACESHLALRLQSLEAERDFLQREAEGLKSEIRQLEAEAAWRKRALGEAEGRVRGLAAHLQDTESAVAALCPVAAGAATGGDTETAGGSDRDPDSSPAAPARPGVSAATAGAPPASKRPPGDLRGQVADPQVQLGGRQELVSMLEADNRDLQHQLETLRVEQEAIESLLARRLQNVEEERDRWRREAEVLETENWRLRVEAVQEEQALEEAERHVRELTARLQNIEAQLAQALEWEATAQERTLAQREQQLQVLGIEPLHLLNEELQDTIRVFCHTQPVLPQERGRQRGPGPLHIPPGDERSLVLFNRLFPPDASQQDVLKDIALLLQIAQIRAITLLLIGWVAQAHLQAEAAAQERAQAQGEQRRLHNLLQEIKVPPPVSKRPPGDLRGQAADPQAQLGGRQERVRVLEAENRDLQHQVETLQGEHEAHESHLALRLQSLEAERDFLQREAEGLKSEIRQLEAEAAWRKRALGEA